MDESNNSCNLVFFVPLLTLNSLPNEKILHWSKLKALANDKINVVQKLKFVERSLENIVEKGENAGYQHFLLSPQCFRKSFISEVVKRQDCLVEGKSAFH